MSAQLDGKDMIGIQYHSVYGPSVSTCSNGTYVISLGQYKAKRQFFNLRDHMQPANNHVIAGTGGIIKATGVVAVPAPFK